MPHEDELIELLDKETIDINLEKQRKAIEAAFRKYDLKGKIVRAFRSPQVNCFDFIVGDGECPNGYRRLLDDLGKVLDDNKIRMQLPIPGSYLCRLEIPSGVLEVVLAGELFRSSLWLELMATLPLMLGKSLEGEIAIMDLAKAPNLLVAGTTGSGKSILMYECILSLLFRHTPDELKLILVDPKYVEFARYKDLPYLQFPVITSLEDTLEALQWLQAEMNRRYEVMRETGCKDIQELNDRKPGTLPYIVMFIDELADFMLESRNQMEHSLSLVCAKGRAAGIHLVIGTARPDSCVLTECVKINFPERIAFQMPDPATSTAFLDGSSDAASLLGRGDMLCRCRSLTLGDDTGRRNSPGEGLTRLQGGYLKTEEATRIIEQLKNMYNTRQPETPPALDDKAYAKLETRDKLFTMIYDILLESINFDDDTLGIAAEEIADAIAGHLDELWIDSGKHSLNEEQKLLLRAVQAILDGGRPTISNLQRRLGIGYNKASAVIEALEACGILSPPPECGLRQVLVKNIVEAWKRIQERR